MTGLARTTSSPDLHLPDFFRLATANNCKALGKSIASVSRLAHWPAAGFARP